ncbi:hypothetical protein Leryth_006245 [Lithospermum erythrorhizon]|nr:hypothetical protein Leryth_006245 [Lithospermum erythrorhizon]
MNDQDSNTDVSDKLSKLSASQLLGRRFVSTNGFVNGNANMDFTYSMNIRSILQQPARYASTAAAAATKQPDLDSDDEDNKELVAKKRKEASAEECDQAVIGLSSAKAKAKAKKQLHEPHQVAKSALRKMWSTLLGIGPALRVVASMSRQDWAKKLAHWKDEFKSTLQHYCLSRRQRQQLRRTTADTFRLVPFAFFIVFPFMQFLLSVFLKLFPGMLPSTFQDKMKEQEALKRKLNAKIEYAKFIQETVKEMAKEVQRSRSGSLKKTTEDLDEFLDRVRTGAGVSNEEILGFAKLFNDELTLDNNISRPPLVNIFEKIEKEEEEREEKVRAKMQDSAANEEDVALQEMVIPTAREAQESARSRALDKQEHLCELSRALAVLASASSVSREREEFLRLVNKEIELKVFFHIHVKGPLKSCAQDLNYKSRVVDKQPVISLISNLSKDKRREDLRRHGAWVAELRKRTIQRTRRNRMANSSTPSSTGFLLVMQR